MCSAACLQFWKIHSCGKSDPNNPVNSVLTCEVYDIQSEVEAELLGQFVFHVRFTSKARALLWALYIPQICTTLGAEFITSSNKNIETKPHALHARVEDWEGIIGGQI